MISYYITRNPLLRAIPEMLVATLLCVGWFVLFDFALESRFPNLFPVSSVSFFIYGALMLVVLYVNQAERLDRFDQMSTAKDAGDDALYQALSYRELNAGAGMRGFAVFTVYVFLLAYPWVLWGYYRWFGLINFAFTAWVLIALLRHSCSYPYSLENDKRHYFRPAADTKRT